MKDLSIETLFGLSEAGVKEALADVDAASVEAIMMEMQNHVDQLNESRGFVAAVYSQKLSLAAAQRKVELMGDEEKAALIQTLNAGGIKNDRPVGDQ